ncbi:MAG: UvrB/UvrC motif-containing protein [Phycisphaerales bacterium]|nr:UvrB/UvrC motif-containing protein [Phycisphaerales bacterium]
MKCDLCNKPAVVHEFQIMDGIKRELHLCQEHAAQQGFADIPSVSMQSVSTKVGVAAVQSPTCGSCGMSFAQIRQAEQLGCPQCFEMFATPVGKLLEQAQHGATHHVGRRPAGSEADLARRHETQRLMRDLEAAVAAEQYERAAEIRDELARMSRDEGE